MKKYMDFILESSVDFDTDLATLEPKLRAFWYNLEEASYDYEEINKPRSKPGISDEDEEIPENPGTAEETQPETEPEEEPVEKEVQVT